MSDPYAMMKSQNTNKGQKMTKLETVIRKRMAIADETAEMFAKSESFDSAETWETVSAILWAILDEAGLSDS